MLPLNMSSAVCVVVAFTWYQMLNEYGLQDKNSKINSHEEFYKSGAR